MEKIFESCVVHNLRSDVIVFKGQNETYNSIEEYIADEYIQRSLYMRDMIIARDERPVPEITRVSEIGSETISTELRISFTSPVYLFRNTSSPYEEVHLSTKISCVNENGDNSALEITHVPSDILKEWTINITSTSSLTGHTIKLAADTFVNVYGNGNLQTEKVL